MGWEWREGFRILWKAAVMRCKDGAKELSAAEAADCAQVSAAVPAKWHDPPLLSIFIPGTRFLSQPCPRGP